MRARSAPLCGTGPIHRTESWVARPVRMAACSRNTPWTARTLTHCVRCTMCDGESVVVQREAGGDGCARWGHERCRRWGGPGRERATVLLVLADGEVFEGVAVGAPAPAGIARGELVFNTVLSGYQEVITDPSYAGQVVAFTYPHVGNYGVNPADDEAPRPWCRGIVVRDLVERPSSWRATGSLEEFLVQNALPGIAGVDTRRLTRHVREDGAMGCAFGTADESELLAAAAAEPGTTGCDLVSGVTTEASYERGSGRFRVVAYDFGVKETDAAVPE